MRSNALLSIGQVNLKTAKNKMFGSMWDCWEQDVESTNYLVKLTDGRMLVAHSSGRLSYKVGDDGMFHHDQSRRPIGCGTIEGVFPHTEEGLAQLKEQTGKKSLMFMTFK